MLLLDHPLLFEARAPERGLVSPVLYTQSNSFQSLALRTCLSFMTCIREGIVKLSINWRTFTLLHEICNDLLGLNGKCSLSLRGI